MRVRQGQIRNFSLPSRRISQPKQNTERKRKKKVDFADQAADAFSEFFYCSDTVRRMDQKITLLKENENWQGYRRVLCLSPHTLRILQVER